MTAEDVGHSKTVNRLDMVIIRPTATLESRSPGYRGLESTVLKSVRLCATVWSLRWNSGSTILENDPRFENGMSKERKDPVRELLRRQCTALAAKVVGGENLSAAGIAGPGLLARVMKIRKCIPPP